MDFCTCLGVHVGRALVLCFRISQSSTHRRASCLLAWDGRRLRTVERAEENREGRPGKRIVPKRNEKCRHFTDAQILIRDEDLPESRLLEQGTGTQHKSRQDIERTIDPMSNGMDIPHTGLIEEDPCYMCLETFVSSDMIRQLRACHHIFHQRCFEN